MEIQNVDKLIQKTNSMLAQMKYDIYKEDNSIQNNAEVANGNVGEETYESQLTFRKIDVNMSSPYVKFAGKDKDWRPKIHEINEKIERRQMELRKKKNESQDVNTVSDGVGNRVSKARAAPDMLRETREVLNDVQKGGWRKEMTQQGKSMAEVGGGSLKPKSQVKETDKLTPKRSSSATELERQILETKTIVNRGFETVRDLKEKIASLEVRRSKTSVIDVTDSPPGSGRTHHKCRKVQDNVSVVSVRHVEHRPLKARKLRLQKLPSLDIRGGLRLQRIPSIDIAPAAPAPPSQRDNAVFKAFSYEADRADEAPPPAKCPGHCHCGQPPPALHHAVNAADLDRLLLQCDFNVLDPRIDNYVETCRSGFAIEVAKPLPTVERSVQVSAETTPKPASEPMRIEEKSLDVARKYWERVNRLESDHLAFDKQMAEIMRAMHESKSIIDKDLVVSELRPGGEVAASQQRGAAAGGAGDAGGATEVTVIFDKNDRKSPKKPYFWETLQRERDERKEWLEVAEGGAEKKVDTSKSRRKSRQQDFAEKEVPTPSGGEPEVKVRSPEREESEEKATSSSTASTVTSLNLSTPLTDKSSVSTKESIEKTPLEYESDFEAESLPAESPPPSPPLKKTAASRKRSKRHQDKAPVIEPLTVPDVTLSPASSRSNGLRELTQQLKNDLNVILSQNEKEVGSARSNFDRLAKGVAARSPLKTNRERSVQTERREEEEGEGVVSSLREVLTALKEQFHKTESLADRLAENVKHSGKTTERSEDKVEGAERMERVERGRSWEAFPWAIMQGPQPTHILDGLERSRRDGETLGGPERSAQSLDTKQHKEPSGSDTSTSDRAVWRPKSRGKTEATQVQGVCSDGEIDRMPALDKVAHPQQSIGEVSMGSATDNSSIQEDIWTS